MKAQIKTKLKSEPEFAQLQSPVSTFSDARPGLRSPSFHVGLTDQQQQRSQFQNAEMSPISNNAGAHWVGQSTTAADEMPEHRLDASNENEQRHVPGAHHSSATTQQRIANAHTGDYSGADHLSIKPSAHATHARSLSSPQASAGSDNSPFRSGAVTQRDSRPDGHRTSSQKHKQQSTAESAQPQQQQQHRLRTMRSVSVSSAVDFSNMRKFLLSPLPQGVHFKCIMVRHKEGILHRLSPWYELFYELPGSNAASSHLQSSLSALPFLMSAKKQVKNKTSHYTISLDQLSSHHHKYSPEPNSNSYLGKVRGNFSGSDYLVFDDGINPKDLNAKEHMPMTQANGRVSVAPKSASLSGRIALAHQHCIRASRERIQRAADNKCRVKRFDCAAAAAAAGAIQRSHRAHQQSCSARRDCLCAVRKQHVCCRAEKTDCYHPDTDRESNR